MNISTATPSKQKPQPFQLFARINFYAYTLLCFSLSIVSYSASAESDKVGQIIIDGESIPFALFEHYKRRNTNDFKFCSAIARKEIVIDRVIAAKQYEIDTGRKISNNHTVIEDIQFSLSNMSDDIAIEKAGDVLGDLKRINRDYMKFLKFTITQRDIYDEYKKRVRDRDPYITNVTIVRVLEIKQPAGPAWDEKLIELATSIQQGTPFEEAEARYPSRYRVKNQTDRWVRLESLPHDINKNTVKVGDVYGIEKILNGDKYYDPMVKIYDVKMLSQVRLSDDIFNGLKLSPNYLRAYLLEKAAERKTHVLMSQLWSNFSITEDGNPIQRVGIYQPCKDI